MLQKAVLFVLFFNIEFLSKYLEKIGYRNTYRDCKYAEYPTHCSVWKSGEYADNRACHKAENHKKSEAVMLL